MAAMDKMHKAMMAANDPDAAKSWAKKMIPHHQGAIEMSEVVLKNTKDPFVTKKQKPQLKNRRKKSKTFKIGFRRNSSSDWRFRNV